MKSLHRLGTFLIILTITLTSACNSHHSSNAPSQPLTTPENLSLKSTGPHQVTLSWSSTSTEQYQFVISRSENGGDFSPIGIVDGTERKYIDDSISTQSVYTYQLYAEDATRTSDSIYSDDYTHPYFDACISTPPGPDTTSVTFFDMPVSGLTYSTNTTYAVSDNTGSFNWDKTGDIKFSLGYINFGTLHSGDKAGINTIALNLGGRTETTRNNLLRLLIALDSDFDTTNGIQIPCSASLAYGEIDPTVDYGSFAQQETVARLTGGTPLPSAQEADGLYYKYLFHDYVGHYELKWKVYLAGIIPFQSTIPFDIDEYGNVINTSDFITYKHIDPLNNYRLRITDLDEIVLGSIGYYKLEVNANILPNQTIKGTVVLNSFIGNDLDGNAWGGRI